MAIVKTLAVTLREAERARRAKDGQDLTSVLGELLWLLCWEQISEKKSVFKTKRNSTKTKSNLDFSSVARALKSFKQGNDMVRLAFEEVHSGQWEGCIEVGRDGVLAQLRLTLCNPVDCSLPASSVHGIFQVRILEWVAIFFFRGSSQPRD